MKNTFVIFMVIGIFYKLSAQTLQKKCVEIPLNGKEQRLDSLTILPQTLQFSEEITFEFDLQSGIIRFTSWPPGKSVVNVCFQTLPFNLTREYQTRSKSIEGKNPAYPKTSEKNVPIPESSLVTTGQIGRGLNGGTNADMSHDSYMDVDVEGEIVEGVKLSARLFDQNIPYQPEGNSHQLKNFDRVLVDIEGKQNGISMGDIRLANSMKNGFLNYARSVSGVELWHRDSTQTARLGIGMNKGKFHVAQFKGQEGMYGPYRIPSPAGEPLIIVIAGTERVYLDGNLLKRGMSEDYIIDYDLSEITFNTSVLISDLSRFRIEFEYRNLNGIRFSKAFQYSAQKGKTEIELSAWQEEDRISELLSQNPGLQDQLLSDGTVIVDVSREISQKEGQISYIKKDIVNLDGSVSWYFEYSTDPNQPHFLTTFSFVGEKKGTYAKEWFEGNVIFRFVGIDESNVPLGSYVAGIPLRLPESKKVYQGRISHLLSNGDKVGVTFALSSHETVFQEQSFNRTGQAIRTDYTTKVRSAGIKNFAWSNKFGMDYISGGFQEIDPFRSAEFNRIWRTDSLDDRGRYDFFLYNQLSIKDKNKDFLDLEGAYRKIGEMGGGLKTKSRIQKQTEQWNILGEFEAVNTDYSEFGSVWRNGLADVSFTGSGIRPGFQFRSESNKIIDLQGEIISGDIHFREYTLYLASNGDSSLGWRLEQITRIDNTYSDGDSEFLSKSYTSRASVFSDNEWQYTRLQFMHRKIVSADSIFSHISGGLQNRLTFLNGGLSVESRFTSVSAWEPRRSFIYVEVPLGQGIYAWRDLNEDGIQQMDEFFEAIYNDEKKYIRLYIPGTDRLAVLDTETGQNLTLHGNRIMKQKENSLFAGFTLRIAWLKKLRTSLGSDVPVFGSLDMADIVSGSGNISSSLIWGLPNKKYRTEFNTVSTTRKNWVNGGNEYISRSKAEWHNSYQLQKDISFHLKGNKETLGLISEVFDSRNYVLERKTYSLSTKWLPKPGVGLSLEHSHTLAQINQESEVISPAILNRYILGAYFSFDQLGRLKSEISQVTINWNDTESGAYSYDLLEGLSSGTNRIWNLAYSISMISDIEVTFQYSGRSFEDRKTVHQASIRAAARF